MEVVMLSGLIGIWVLFQYLYLRRNALVWVVLNRWVRWVLFALIVGQLPFVQEWADRPAWVISLTAFILWFVGETALYWIGISAFSKSDLPLFPSFRAIDKPMAWPSQKHYIEIKEWIRENGYRLIQTLRSDIHPSIGIESSVYQNQDDSIRLQVLLMPQKVSGVRMYFIFSTRFENEDFFVTDNFSLPFGGFYPSNWSVLRSPLRSSVAKLEAMHKERLPEGEKIQAWGEDPLEDFRHEHRILDEHNVRAHFLTPRHDRDECGKISKEGRYRLWKQMWLMNYLGVAINS